MSPYDVPYFTILPLETNPSHHYLQLWMVNGQNGQPHINVPNHVVVVLVTKVEHVPIHHHTMVVDYV